MKIYLHQLFKYPPGKSLSRYLTVVIRWIVQSSPNEFILREIITKGKAGSTAVEHKTSHFLKLFGNELWGIVNDLKQGRFFLHDYVNYHWLCFIHLGDILSSFRR